MRYGMAVAMVPMMVPILLGGCLPVLPPAASLVSAGFSSFVMVSTGKSTADHVISAAADEDCSMLRVVFGEEPCRAYDGDTEKPLTELVAYYPGDRDDWVDEGSIPAGTVSGKTIFTVSTSGTDTVEGPDESVSTTLQSEDSSAEDRLNDSPFSSNTDPRLGNAGLLPDDNVSPVGFAPFEARHALKPVEPKGIVSIDEQVDMPVSAVGSWKVLPVLDLGDGERESDDASKGEMTIVPVLRPHGRASAQSAAVQPAEHFVMLGSFRDKNRAQRLKERTLSSGGPASVIMSVQIEGSVWHRVAVGPFSGKNALLMASALETVSDRKPWAAKVIN